MNEKNFQSSSLWLIWPIIILAVFVIAVFTYSIRKENAKKKQVEAEIESLKQQAEQIEKENMALKDRIAYLGSEDYQKMQAKDKLNLQSPGENVVVIAPGPEKKTEIMPIKDEKEADSEEIVPNYKKWLKYFFDDSKG